MSQIPRGGIEIYIFGTRNDDNQKEIGFWLYAFIKELEAVEKVQEIFHSMHLIPDLFAVMNANQIYHDGNADYYYYEKRLRF